LISATHGVTEQ
jgi:hypothetical protein